MSYQPFIDDVQILKGHLKHVLDATHGCTKCDIVDYNEVIAYIQGYITAVLYDAYEDEKDG